MTRKTPVQSDDWQVLFKGMTPEKIAKSFRAHREYSLAKDQYSATVNDHYLALALTIRDRVIERWIKTQQSYHRSNVKKVYYLSMEFLIGRLMGNYIYNLGLEEACPKAMESLGFDYNELAEQEMDAGLGNGGLGRLAACFLDSMASLGIPGYGYGIRFDYGIFNQKIRDGYQVEGPDEWLNHGTPWEHPRPERSVTVKFGGRVVSSVGHDGIERFEWIDTENVIALPYDMPVPGFKNQIVNTLRLWSARSTDNFDFDYFKHGDYERAVHQKISSEVISKVLYPSDDISRGRELRLKQEYFLTAASVYDIIRRFSSENADVRTLPDKVVIQINDTHPCMAIPELMRILLDEHELHWEEAWSVTTRTFAYTNHTLMPEALECWPLDLMQRLLPRHLQIIFEINARFLREVSIKYPGDLGRLERMSLISEGNPKRVRMANLAIVGSFSVNGVSALHSELLKTNLLRDFHEYYPGKFNNKTNGITPRQWLLKSNPKLSGLITDAIGDAWIHNLGELRSLAKFTEDAQFLERWRTVKEFNKQALASYVLSTMGITIDPQSMFDVQVKRIHEYKRQLMFAFFMIAHYLSVKRGQCEYFVPRTFIVAGKAAPGYYMAKLSIKLINCIAEIINQDTELKGKLHVVFLENYRVSLAERIFPASDLSEQISTAGTEASGTGNMKFMLNGALTIGTWDGANIEIAEQVGSENIFVFGHRAHEVDEIKKKGYRPQEWIDKNPRLREVLDLISQNFFSPFKPGLFNPILDSIYNIDPYLICADFEMYCKTQELASKLFASDTDWTKKSILNTSAAGHFSSDRTIKEYAREIWRVI